MSKAAFSRKYTLNATGILSIENPDTGELIPLSDLMADFKDKTCKLSLNYDETMSKVVCINDPKKEGYCE